MKNLYLIVAKRENGEEYYRDCFSSKQQFNRMIAHCKKCPDVQTVETFSGKQPSHLWDKHTFWERKQAEMAQIKKNERRYVALSWYQVNHYSHKAQVEIVTVGLPGVQPDNVAGIAHAYLHQCATSKLMYDTLLKNMFVVTESVCKRSYKRAWDNWMENSN